MNILETIVERTRERIQKEKQTVPLEEVRRQAEEKSASKAGKMPRFEKALRKNELSFICEVKKASPSKGIIAEDFPYLSIALDYEMAGAMGASAVLLICSVLDDGELQAYFQLSKELGLSALVEAHSEEEIERAKKAGAVILGVNNRNLKDFSVDLSNSARLRSLAGEETVFVSESGIRDERDIRTLWENGTDAVLIGEMLMRAPDRRQALQELKKAAGQSTEEVR